MFTFPSLIALQLDLKGQAVNQNVPYVQAGTGGFGVFLSNILTAVMAVAALSVFLYLLWGAFDYINSDGEKGKIETARKKMSGAVMGLVILATVVVIFSLIQQMIGVELLQFTAPLPPANIDEGGQLL